MMDIAQYPHLRFGIPFGLLQFRIEDFRQLFPVRRAVERSGVEQFIEQNGMLAQIIARPGTRTRQSGNLFQRMRVFLEQGQVGRSAADRFQQIERPSQGLIRVGLNGSGFYHQGNQFVDALLAG